MKVLVTGGSGFLGKTLIPALELLPEVEEIIAPTSKELNLMAHGWEIADYINMRRPDTVIHCAAKCGGIGANSELPYSFYADNMKINFNIIDAITRANTVEKSVMVNSVCAYPKDVEVPMKESDLWLGYPEETNAPYGLAKKMMIVQARAAFDQYEKRIGNLLLTNLYGEGDNFDPGSSHIIPAIIRRVEEARALGRESIECWGDGTATRDLLHVSDAARAIVQYITSPEPPVQPINIGTGIEVSIKDVVQNICEAYEYDGQIIWDTSKPNGQPRRCLDIQLAQELIGFSPLITLKEGIYKTVRFYREFYANY